MTDVALNRSESALHRIDKNVDHILSSQLFVIVDLVCVHLMLSPTIALDEQGEVLLPQCVTLALRQLAVHCHTTCILVTSSSLHLDQQPRVQETTALKTF